MSEPRAVTIDDQLRAASVEVARRAWRLREAQERGQEHRIPVAAQELADMLAIVTTLEGVQRARQDEAQAAIAAPDASQGHAGPENASGAP